MGEIRVRVKLTNATDDTLRRGRKLSRKKVRTYEADAVVDTGAVRSVVPPHVLEALGVGTRGTRVAGYADGRTEAVGISDGILFDVLGRNTLEEAFVLGDEVLIGQTVLEKLDLLADCANRRLVPNPAHPDQPVNKIRRRWEVYPPPAGSA
jgi:predicted aspartyl protease